MKDKPAPLLFLAAPGMELSWLLAAGILLLSFSGTPLWPFLPALPAFFLGVLLTRFMRNRGGRVITGPALHLLLLIVLLLPALHRCIGPKEPLWSRGWLAGLLSGPSSLAEGLFWGAVALTVILFWGGGVCLARRPLSYRAITTRFDAGVAIFLLLLPLGASINSKPAVAATYMLSAFFLFSIPAIALARHRQGGIRGEFLSRYRGSGSVLTFTAAVLLGGGAVLLLFYPFLRLVAENSYTVLQQYGLPLAEFLARVLLTIMGYGSRIRSDAPAQSAGELDVLEGGPVDGEAGWVRYIILLFTVLIAMGALSLGIWGLWQLLRRLFTVVPGGKKPRGLIEILCSSLRRLHLLWQRLVFSVRHIFARRALLRSRRGAVRFFALLLVWGGRSGLKRRATETPHEYALVLGKNFPGVHREIRLIVDCFNCEVYGGEVLDSEKQRLMQRAWRILCSPRHWPVRLYHRLSR